MPSDFEAVVIEPSLRDLCEVRGWELIDLGQRLDPPVSKATISRLSRGLRQLAPLYAKQMATLLQVPESQILRSITEGARRDEVRRQFLMQSSPSSKPATKRPRKTA